MLSSTEENYIKSIYNLSNNGKDNVSTNAIADSLKTKPASANSMINKLADKKLITYKKYNGVTLTKSGKTEALNIIRRHRLWEVFLVEKLHFNWDEVHEIAEQLEHVKSPLLISRIDHFLGHPKFDPHGDPIPDAEGEIEMLKHHLLFETKSKTKTIVTGVKNSSDAFLKHLNKLEISLGTELEILEIIPFDNSFEISINNKQVIISKEIAQNIYVTNK